MGDSLLSHDAFSFAAACLELDRFSLGFFAILFTFAHVPLLLWSIFILR
jgi:hypothetical protein